MKIYIAGPMTGYEDWNFTAFFNAEHTLSALGHEVVNPAHNDGATIEEALRSAGDPSRPNNSWSYYMRRDLPHVLGVDAVCVLPGWQNSRGASLEVYVAKAVGIPLYILRDGVLKPRVEVIGVSGWARAGKDTIADYLVATSGYKKMSFADSMREALVKLDPNITIGGLTASLASVVARSGWEELKGMSPDIRPLLQRFGTEVGREMWGENFWVDASIDKIEDGSKVIFADVRFPNEANAIKGLGGEVWRVTRDGFGPANDHISEHALDDFEFDKYISNAGTLEELYLKVEKVSGGNG
jgi:hypothetical protein